MALIKRLAVNLAHLEPVKSPKAIYRLVGMSSNNLKGVTWFKEQGPGYQSRIHALLRTYMEAHDRNNLSRCHRNSKLFGC
jgi:hypothetical protein